jgi:hypothetical protein
VCLVGLAHAADSDLSTATSGQDWAAPDSVAAFTVSYHNAGPETAGSAIVDIFIPSGVPAPIDELTQEQFDAITASLVPDALGNTPLLFSSVNNCEELLIQVQGPVDAMVGLDSGVGDEVGFELEIPMEQPAFGAVVIDQPPALAQEFRAAVTSDHHLHAAGWGRYSRGGCAEGADCTDLSQCLGPRISLIDPIEADFELVNDGSEDPTFGCSALIGFTPGNIAVIQRGGCEFGEKGFLAQNAGAVAVFMVNSTQCGTPPDAPPDSEDCVVGMGAGALGDLVTIPMVQVANGDGMPIITSLGMGNPVRGRIGPVGQTLTVDAAVWLMAPADSDPDPANNTSGSELVFLELIFGDGFESNDTDEWSDVVPE